MKDAVARIHAAGLQHRRLTASNVIVTGTACHPGAVIVDLGVEALSADGTQQVGLGLTERSRSGADTNRDETAVSRLAELLGLNSFEVDAL